MKKYKIILTVVLLFVLAICQTGCRRTPGLYQLDDIIPELMDTQTQYPYTTAVVVNDKTTSEQIEFTEGVDHDKIRMQFEGIKCYLEKLAPTYNYRDGVKFTVTFVTTDGDVSIEVISKDTCVIDGYIYHAMTSGIDLVFFESLFADN